MPQCGASLAGPTTTCWGGGEGGQQRPPHSNHRTTPSLGIDHSCSNGTTIIQNSFFCIKAIHENFSPLGGQVSGLMNCGVGGIAQFSVLFISCHSFSAYGRRLPICQILLPVTLLSPHCSLRGGWLDQRISQARPTLPLGEGPARPFFHPESPCGE